ncbi:hypothetical protein BV509_13500 [Rhodovulum sulfidophilum]|nr:hypothetical protein BV509_13500 [Rhodovulum sulfidophilum]
MGQPATGAPDHLVALGPGQRLAHRTALGQALHRKPLAGPGRDPRRHPDRVMSHMKRQTLQVAVERVGALGTLRAAQQGQFGRVAVLAADKDSLARIGPGHPLDGEAGEAGAARLGLLHLVRCIQKAFEPECTSRHAGLFAPK